MARSTTWLVFGLLVPLFTRGTSPDPGAPRGTSPNPGAPRVENQPSLSQLCPYTSLCSHTTNRSLDDPALQACCLPCSCSPQCAAVDKCCPDVPVIHPPTKVYPCRSQKLIYTDYLNLTKAQATTRALEFLVIDGCPEAAFQVSELTESMARCYTAAGIDDLVFVTGTASGITYLNKHCAACNNDVPFTAWNLYVLDRDVLTETVSFEERDRRILSSGQIMSVPVQHDLASLALCNTETISTCNETREWDVYDVDVEAKCHGLREGIAYFTDYRCGIQCNYYANVYCFLCNHPRGVAVPSQCQRVDLSSSFGRSFIETPFSALLTAAPRPGTDKTRCAIGEILEPFHMSCTQLYCPTGNVAWYGTCTSVVQDEVGYIVYVAMQLVIHDSAINPANIDQTDVMHDVARVMMRRVNNRTTSCDLCDVALIQDARNDELYVTANLVTTSSCRAGTLLHGISRLFRSASLNVTLPDTQLAVKLVNVKVHPVEYVDKHASLLTVDVFTSCSRGAQFLFNETIFCPSVHLTSDHVRDMARYDAIVELMTSRSVAVGNGSVHVCVTEYEAALEAAGLVSEGAQQQQSCSTLFVTVIVALLSFVGPTEQ